MARLDLEFRLGLGDRSGIPGLDWACGWETIWGSPGPEIDIVSRIELGYSYELGSGRTRIGVLTRPRKRSGTVMTQTIKWRCIDSWTNGWSCQNKHTAQTVSCKEPHNGLRYVPEFLWCKQSSECTIQHVQLLAVEMVPWVLTNLSMNSHQIGGDRGGGKVQWGLLFCRRRRHWRRTISTQVNKGHLPNLPVIAGLQGSRSTSAKMMICRLMMRGWGTMKKGRWQREQKWMRDTMRPARLWRAAQRGRHTKKAITHHLRGMWLVMLPLHVLCVSMDLIQTPTLILYYRPPAKKRHALPTSANNHSHHILGVLPNWECNHCRDCPIPGCICRIGSTDTGLSTLAYVGLS